MKTLSHAEATRNDQVIYQLIAYLFTITCMYTSEKIDLIKNRINDQLKMLPKYPPTTGPDRAGPSSLCVLFDVTAY